MKKIIFYAIVCFPTWIFSQAYAPLYKVPYTLQNDSNQNLFNYQVLITFNTASPISSGHMRPDGGDIRFSADSCNPVSFYNYWIEDSVNNNSTKIWVNIPFLMANSPTTFMLWYGDSLSTSQSNFNLTFPNAYISNGNDTILGGNLYFDWFQVDSGDVIHLQAGSQLKINSRVIKINGSIDGTGKGYAAPLFAADGNGPGGGGTSMTAGAGGASYAGFGGTGGMDAGDIPGTGGPVYGFSNDINCLMGSSGGTTDNAIGGNGGGAIQLNAEWIEIEGSILANGMVGIGSIGRCGGGGSGGTILLKGENIDFGSNSMLAAIGGNGGNGSSAANDGGGGGSGGRIKIFRGINSMSSTNFSLLGGAGGVFGSLSYGTSGENGSYFNTNFNSLLVYFSSIGNETDLVAKIIGLDSVYCLNKDSILLTALPPGGTFAIDGIASTYFYPLAAGVGVHAISYLYNDPYGCGTLYDTVFVTVLNVPTFPFANNNSPICEGDILNLSSSDSLATHYWLGPNGFTANSQSPVVNNAGEQNNGNYTVTITNAVGCSSSVVTTVTVNSIPEATVTNNSPICINQDLSFVTSGAAGATYSWNGPNGFTSGLQSPILANTQFVYQGTYTVTIYSPSGCQATITTEVQVNGCYDGVENESNKKIVLVYPNPTYDDLWIDVLDKSMMSEMNIDLYDVYGKKIMHRIMPGSINNRFKLELNEIANGTYIILISNSSSTSSFKIVKQ